MPETKAKINNSPGVKLIAGATIAVHTGTAYYRRLIELWKGSDRELQPRLEEIQQRSDRLETFVSAA
jgi:hypothetical protein